MTKRTSPKKSSSMTKRTSPKKPSPIYSPFRYASDEDIVDNLLVKIDSDSPSPLKSPFRKYDSDEEILNKLLVKRTDPDSPVKKPKKTLIKSNRKVVPIEIPRSPSPFGKRKSPSPSLRSIPKLILSKSNKKQINKSKVDNKYNNAYDDVSKCIGLAI